MTNKEAIEQLRERLAITDYKQQIPEYYEAIELAVEALEKVEAYERFIEDFVFEGGYGDYSAMCGYMKCDNDAWCSEHCGADAPYLECAIRCSMKKEVKKDGNK